MIFKSIVLIIYSRVIKADFVVTCDFYIIGRLVL